MAQLIQLLDYGFDELGIVVQFVARSRNYFLFQNFQNCSETHTAAY